MTKKHRGKTRNILLTIPALRRRRTILPARFVALFAIGIASVFMWGLLSMAFAGRVLPIVYAGGQYLGFQTSAGAVELVRNAVQTISSRTLRFTWRDAAFEIPVKDLPITWDVASTAQALPTFGIMDNPARMATPSTQKIVYEVDVKKLASLLENRLHLADAKMKNARLTLQQNNFIIVPARAGFELDEAHLLETLSDRLFSAQAGPIELKLDYREPLLTHADLEAAYGDVTEKLKQKILLFHEGRAWKFRPADHLGITFFEKNTEGRIRIAYDQSALEQYFNETVAETVDAKEEAVRIYQGENGAFVFEGSGRDGKKVNLRILAYRAEEAVNEKKEEVEIPVDRTKAPVAVNEKLQPLGIQELIAVGHTSFAGSPANRRYNIAAGISQFHGALIKPREEFSFNTQLGPVTPKRYLEELTIKPEGTIPEIGGGLCQVSTTAFRAALNAGLPIAERTPHTYAVRYYALIGGHGLDATIYPGSRDLKFLNDTPGHILIQAYVEGTDAYFKFYGTPDGRRVELEGPYAGNYKKPAEPEYIQTITLPVGQQKQMEKPHTGFEVTWYRTTTRQSETVRERIFSRYKAVPAKFLVGSTTTLPPSNDTEPSFRD